MALTEKQRQDILNPYVVDAKIDGIPYQMVMKEDALTAMDEYCQWLRQEIDYWKQKHDTTANSLIQEIETLRNRSQSDN